MSVTSIEWTATVNPDGSVTPGKVWNPVRGCVKVSPGCAHCYAETFAERWRGLPGHPYEQGFDLRLVPEKLTEPLSWRKPARVFVNSMSDLFQPNVDGGFIAAAFGIMQACPHLTFQVLTKRPDTMRKFFETYTPEDVREYTLRHTNRMIAGGWTWPLPNVWLGVSVENPAFLHRIDTLKDIPAAVRFVSFEPLLENLGALILDRIHWAIVGGESGPGARPCRLEWVRAVVEQCRSWNTPVFVKQLGAHAVTFSGTMASDINWSRLVCRDRKGGDVSEWPEDLRVREFPQTGAPR